MAACPKEERNRLTALVHALETLVIRISMLVSRRQFLREISEPGLRLQCECLDVEFKQVLAAFAECFRQGDCQREIPTVQGALSEMDHAVQEIRDRNLLGNLPPEVSLRCLDIVDRYHATAGALDECGRVARSLRIDRYWGDYAL
ncbi:MAG: hypothetical protein JO251_06730 [Verrucomicrobia bacterium]|nr:hypothetical protein [Verrucomicrobiota bacterium]